jgi:hypothetical protein
MLFGFLCGSARVPPPYGRSLINGALRATAFMFHQPLPMFYMNNVKPSRWLGEETSTLIRHNAMKDVTWLSSSEVIRRIDISLRQLYYWELKGVIKPKIITKGSREFKRYSMRDVEILRRIKEYLTQGFTLASAVQRAGVETVTEPLRN